MKQRTNWEGRPMTDREKKCIFLDCISELIIMEDVKKFTVNAHLSRDFITVMTLHDNEQLLISEHMKALINQRILAVENSHEISIGGQLFIYDISTDIQGLRVDYTNGHTEVYNIGKGAYNFDELMLSYQKFFIFPVKYTFRGVIHTTGYIRARTYREFMAYGLEQKRPPFFEPETIIQRKAKRNDGLWVKTERGNERMMLFEHFCAVFGVHVTRPQFKEWAIVKGADINGWYDMDYWQGYYDSWNNKVVR